MDQKGAYNILLAEDDEDDVYLFQEALAQIGENVNLVVAENGEELMEKFNEASPAPHLVVLDINMPVKNGIKCLEEIRASGKAADIPVVILSTSTDTRLIDQSFERGANLYVEKPPTFNSLKEIIEKFLLKPSVLETVPERESFLLINKG